MRPDYRKRLVKLVADIDLCCAGLEDLTPEEQEWAELAEVLRREQLKTQAKIEGKLRAE
jgi:hypothetical protein